MLFACCKEEIAPVYDDPLIGSWNIVSVESIMSIYPWDASVSTFRYKPDYTGNMHFNSDSTGFFEGSITSISGGQSSFLWKHEPPGSPPPDRLELQFLNGYSSVYLDSIEADTVNFYFRDYLNSRTGPGGAYWYHLKCVVR